MEEVGYRPNWVSSSIHCKAYYHSIGTQKTGEQYIPTAESDFHVYAVEWTEDYIKGFVNGKCHFTCNNDKTGNKKTWKCVSKMQLLETNMLQTVCTTMITFL